MKNRILVSLVFVFLLAFGSYGQTKVHVRFTRGASSASLRGTVSGYRYVDYLVGARAGQTMSVSLTSSSEWAQFVVFDPAMENVEGSNGETDWSGQLPSAGTYTVRILLPRAEARRKGSMANYSVRISIR